MKETIEEFQAFCKKQIHMDRNIGNDDPFERMKNAGNQSDYTVKEIGDLFIKEINRLAEAYKSDSIGKLKDKLTEIGKFYIQSINTERNDG